MIKKLLLLPLVVTLSGCINNSKGNNAIENVQYYFNHDRLCYVVVVSEKNYDVRPNNFYTIRVDTFEYTSDKKEILFNEFYVTTKELYVYERR